MAVDNPSYFSLSGEASSSAARTTTMTTAATTTSPRNHSSGFSALFWRRPNNRMGTAISQGAVLTEPTSGVPTHHDARGNASDASTPTEERAPMLSQNGAVQPGSGKRRSFRNLFRSVSANADNERTQKFLKGDPRPSDVAPPSSYLPYRSHSHSEKDRHRPGRGRRVLKSANELLSNERDMIYCGLTGNCKDRNSDVDGNADDDDDNDDNGDDDDDDDDDAQEVFLGVNDARYYNISSTLPASGSTTVCQRRHSIGTFLGKEAAASGSAAATLCQQTAGSRNQLEADAPAAPVFLDDTDGGPSNEEGPVACARTRHRRRRNSSNKRSHSTTRDGHAEDDVLFVSSKDSEASKLWTSYLSACFEQISRQQGRPPYRIRQVAIEEPIAPKMEERIRSSRLQVVVVCPVLLERVRANPEQTVHLTRHLVNEKVLAMMLGVHDSYINDSHKSSLVCYDQWRKFFVKDQDETFVGELLGAAVGILGTAPPPALRADKTAFSVHPKKVKLGQNRIIVLLNDPLTVEDHVSVVIDRCGDAIDISNVKRRNPYALQFSIPERCLEVSMLVGVRISKNGCSLGVRQVKCESRLRELDQILRAHDNPLEFMCQTFGFSSTDREQLDNWMVHAFQKNIPPHFNLLSTPSGLVPTHKKHTSPEESPTLLHFAARFGLEKLAWQLLECPGGDLACDLRNISEMTPADLAEQGGHTRLAHQLRGYMQINEFSNMYSYLKVISETTTNRPTDHDPPATDAPLTATAKQQTSNENEDYCLPRPLSEAYLVPPIARPVTTLISSLQTTTVSTTMSNLIAANYSVVPTPTPVILPFTTATCNPSNGLDPSLQDYMQMYPVGSKISTTNTTKLLSSRTGTPTQCTRLESHQGSSAIREDNPSPKISQPPAYGRTSSNSSSSKSREPSGPQDELLEIINDFKNNVFTISEVERLVENWQKRNDVQQSFKDKQRQLMAMREEYDRIQKKMKEEMKTATPFDKIRRFFSKGKKDTKESASVASDLPSGKSENVNGGLVADRRPVSSLSLRSVSSSSSSGRMSTVSGCSGTSLGDSGTHSDSEERRLQNLRDEKASGMTSYEIPPAPKPFTGRYSPAPGYSPSPGVSVTRDLDLRPARSPSRADDNEYYIAFPPSGLPVHAFKADGSPREPNTPSSPSPACERTKCLDFAQNIVVPSNKQEDGTEATRRRRHVGNDGYTNIEPTSSTRSSPSDSARVPDRNESTSVDPVNSARANEGITRERRGDADEVSETCHPEDTLRTVLAQSAAVDEVDSVARSTEQDNAVKYEQAYPPAGSTKHTNIEAGENGRMPEYMNLAVNMGHDSAKVLGAIPKKLPAPPVPPRVTTKK
ncbi:phosphoinositide 3-kinase adapter protein 1 isoform X1 [Harpegnathos saltator]|uniref:phosphoinositide 3-kinase adapter protein 1 isoform X1 n=1 Tax=Harpegnathos saltator TaxID=610380 RepID=UPI000DBEDC50|nr:phosphoinositide 3-kinase adapter protein 1 isoform X1 [Harpegnathos saltator]